MCMSFSQKGLHDYLLMTRKHLSIAQFSLLYHRKLLSCYKQLPTKHLYLDVPHAPQNQFKHNLIPFPSSIPLKYAHNLVLPFLVNGLTT